jgi:hypothetical protein
VGEAVPMVSCRDEVVLCQQCFAQLLSQSASTSQRANCAPCEVRLVKTMAPDASALLAHAWLLPTAKGKAHSYNDSSQTCSRTEGKGSTPASRRYHVSAGGQRTYVAAHARRRLTHPGLQPVGQRTTAKSAVASATGRTHSGIQAGCNVAANLAHARMGTVHCSRPHPSRTARTGNA